MHKPIIGITMSKKADKVEGARDFIPAAYTIAVQKAGGIPLLIPNELPLENIPELRESLAGVLLSGGGDLSPGLYHQQKKYPLCNVNPERDALEMNLATLAINTDWPLLGICRGHQLINVALGGSLYQHVPEERPSRLIHNTPDTIAKEHIAHQVDLVKGSMLHRILDSENIEVNSRHHQAVHQLAPGLSISARATDELIEGIELPGHRFCLGVQWHPENLQAFTVHQRLFNAFIKAAGG